VYDSYYKSKVDNPEHYDRMISLILIHNPGCKDAVMAAATINVCIREALLDKADYATGMCMALYHARGDKVRLFLEPLGHVPKLL
jgi:hypothetical protein